MAKGLFEVVVIGEDRYTNAQGVVTEQVQVGTGREVLTLRRADYAGELRRGSVLFVFGELVSILSERGRLQVFFSQGAVIWGAGDLTLEAIVGNLRNGPPKAAPAAGKS